MSISILIHTKNEEQDLPGCLESVKWSDDIHVFDSMSVDRTVEIAEKYGAIVTKAAYLDNNLAFGGDESAHRNWGLKNIPFKYSWVYFIDADERLPKETVEKLKEAISKQSNYVAYRIQRRDYFQNTWLKHVTPSPFNIRLFKPESISYERLTNPVVIVDGGIGEINGYFNHYPFSKGISHWFNKHNEYSSYEAKQILEAKKYKIKLTKIFISRDRNERRYHQKEFYYKLPIRPIIMFMLLYFIKRGFLDGRAGFTYAILRAIYEYMIVLKVAETKNTSKIIN